MSLLPAEVPVPCPCGLTREELDLHVNLVGEGGLCTALDRNRNPCGRRLADHPRSSGKSLFLVLAFS